MYRLMTLADCIRFCNSRITTARAQHNFDDVKNFEDLLEHFERCELLEIQVKALTEEDHA